MWTESRPSPLSEWFWVFSGRNAELGDLYLALPWFRLSLLNRTWSTTVADASFC